jgi:hypothetical protein
MQQTRGNKMNEQDFICFVRQYALDHYDAGGWDEVAEAWGNGDILEFYSDADGNEKKAFKEIAKTVKLRHDYSNEIRSTKF